MALKNAACGLVGFQLLPLKRKHAYLGHPKPSNTYSFWYLKTRFLGMNTLFFHFFLGGAWIFRVASCSNFWSLHPRCHQGLAAEGPGGSGGQRMTGYLQWLGEVAERNLWHDHIDRIDRIDTTKSFPKMVWIYLVFLVRRLSSVARGNGRLVAEVVLFGGLSEMFFEEVSRPCRPSRRYFSVPVFNRWLVIDFQKTSSNVELWSLDLESAEV